MNDQSVSNQANGSSFPKTFTPYVQPIKQFQPFVPSTIAISSPPNLIKQSDNKLQQNKITSKISSNTLNGSQSMINPNNGGTLRVQNNGFKPIPSFLQGRNQMKGSMINGQGQMLNKSYRGQGNQNGSQAALNLKKARVSDGQQDMKYSSIELTNESKVPSFLQDKSKKSFGFNGPDSTKQINAMKVPTGQNSLSSSYGGLKKNRSDKQQQPSKKNDPAAEWLKTSMGMKKQKQITINDFQQIKQLGTGKYGKVYLARQKKSNFICALKILQKSLIKQEQITGQIIRQLKIQSFLNHTNLIKMYGFFDDNANIYLIMEAATGGQLFKQLKKHQSMPEAKVASIMRQVCQAVNQLHGNRIIHRDIKPQNIVLHDNVIKLCDFGWSVYCDSSLRTTFCGTPLYVGPEILKGKEYDEKIDIWSLGVMMYEMLVGQNPFKINKEDDLIKIIKDQIKIPNYVQISNQGKDFLFSCLKKNPEERLSIRQLINHQFFKKFPEKHDKKIGI